MGPGFYLSANPEVAVSYAKRKAAQKRTEDSPAVLIEFSVSEGDALRLMGCKYGQPSDGQQLASGHFMGFFRDGHAQDNFNFFESEAIKMLKMDAVYLLVCYEVLKDSSVRINPNGIHCARAQSYVAQIEQAQARSRRNSMG